MTLAFDCTTCDMFVNKEVYNVQDLKRTMKDTTYPVQVLQVLTNDCHERVEVANVDTFFRHIYEVLDHSHSVLLLQVLNQ